MFSSYSSSRFLGPIFMNPPSARNDRIEPVEPNDKIEPADPNDRIEPAEPNDMIDPVEKADIIEPMDPIDAIDQIDRTENREPIDNSDRLGEPFRFSLISTSGVGGVHTSDNNPTPPVNNEKTPV